MTHGKSFKLFLISFYSLFFSLSILAQEPDSSENYPERYYQLDGVTVLGIHQFPSTRDRSDLGTMEMMSHDAGAILTRIPAISGIRKGGGYGFDPVLRGFKYSQLGIMIDGIQTSTVACPNRMDPPTSQVTVNSISNVEIHKGPYSLRYGNHIGGLINFRTAAPAYDSESGFFSRVSAGYESNGSLMRTEAMAGARTKKGAYQIMGSWHNGENYIDGNGSEVPSGFRRANIGLVARVKLSDKQQLSTKLSRNFARDAAYAALPMDLRSDDTWLLHLNHEAVLGNDEQFTWSSSGSASYVDHLMDNLDKQLDPRMLNASTSVKTRNMGARSELKYVGTTVRLQSGVDLKIENANGYREREFLMGPNAGNMLTDNVWQNGRIVKTGIFAEYMRKSRTFRYHLSGRINLNMADALDPDIGFSSLYTSLNSTQINPGISGGIEYPGKKQYSLALWAGRVQRSGDLSERYMNSFPVGLDPYELIGNPDLQPEINNQVDLIFKLKRNSATIFEINLFFSYLQNYISSVIRPDLSPKMPSAPGVRQYINIDEASIAGFEFKYIQELPLQILLRADIAASLGTNLVDGYPLAEIPPVDFRTSFVGSYLEDRLMPGVNLRYAAKQSRISTEFGESETPAFFLIDMDISYKAFGRLILSSGVRNLFDIAYYEHLNRSVKSSGVPIYNPGRNIYLGMSLKIE